MKKSLFFVAAASALMLTACSSENDVLQSATPSQPTTVQQAVGFDVYTPAATNVTRAGLEGTMTTDHMKRTEYQGGGFGVYAYQVQDDATAKKYVDWMSQATPNHEPNFMANEKLLWNATNQGWYYNPLKYWPNETNNDSQVSAAEMIGTSTKHLDRLSFFAYAPYVVNGDLSKPGIMRLTDNGGRLSNLSISGTGESFYNDENVKREASIQYKAAISDPNQAVDLLWGVAPSGGLTYTAVNGQTVTVEEGMPLIDMTKPNVNTNMKFLFQHALARIGVTAVAAIDQVGAGGKLDPNTKITIEKITLNGYFGETGILNLDNINPSIAKWEVANDKKIKDTNIGDLTKTTLTLQADHTIVPPVDDGQKGSIATHLQFVGTATDPSAASAKPVEQKDRSGVTTIRQSVIQPALIDNAAGKNRNWYTMKTYGEKELAYSETTPYYTNADCKVQATVTMPASYTVDSKGVYTEVAENTSFKYPNVLQNYKESTGFTLVTTETAASFVGYQAYSNYKPKEGALAANNYIYAGSSYYQVPAAEVAYYSAQGYKPYTKLSDGVYIPVSGNPRAQDYVVADGIYFYKLVDANKDYFKGEQLYEYSLPKYTPRAVGAAPIKGNYVLCGKKELYLPYYAAGTYYKRDANYFMVVPTNNFINENPDLSSSEEKLRTVRVMIEYYITTEDSKLGDGRAQTKNVIEKDVVFPSLANGKSYNLNLILGLTSVKMEAEVDDWKVINVQADLPQNTDGN